MAEPESLPAPDTCAGCGAQLGPGLLACPGCHRLRHAERLAVLAGEARQAEAGGDRVAALGAWREVLPLLPPGSRQQEHVAQRVAALVREVDSGAAVPKRPASSGRRWGRKGGLLGAAALLLWKLKAVLVFLATKAKLLLLGLTQAGTLLSMLGSIGVYWAVFGWQLAVGLVLSIYVHEMGHVAELRRRGFPATAPMFIPGVGAVVRLHQRPSTPVEDARIGLAGPIWGLGAALCCWLAFFATGAPLLAALAQLGAWINLFNLLPVWQLDGARGFASLTRSQRLVATAAIGLAFALTREGLLVLLLIAAVVKCLAGPRPQEPDQVGLAWYVGLVAALSAMTLIPVPIPG